MPWDSDSTVIVGNVNSYIRLPPGVVAYLGAKPFSLILYI